MGGLEGFACGGARAVIATEQQDPWDWGPQMPLPIRKHASAMVDPTGGSEKHHMSETATMTPEPQRLRALERANAVRLARAELKRRIAEGEASAAEVILEPPDAALSWAIGELLMSQRRWGATKCRKFLARYQITETKPIGALTDRQRRVISSALETCAVRALELVPA